MEFDGKEQDIPLLVPGLTRKQIDLLVNGGKVTDEIFDIAVAHARKRIKEGKSPYADNDEKKTKLPKE